MSTINNLFIIFAIKLFGYGNCSNPLCKINVIPPRPSIPNIGKIIRTIRAENFGPKIIDDILVTEAEIAKDVVKFNRGKENEDVNLNLYQLVNKYGYDIEEHEVVTEDGYVLTLQRIPGNGRVVFLMHGILSSADDWVTSGPKNGLAYNLADAGYDVWMGNARGNTYSKKHLNSSPDCAEFWDFSWDEIGRYDLPASIDYVLNVTGKSELSYIGWSQGTTSFFIMASERPDYNKKISVMVSLAPEAYAGHMTSPLFRLYSSYDGIKSSYLGNYGTTNAFFGSETLTKALMSVLCGNNAFSKIICSNTIFLLTGFDRGQMNVTNLPVFLSHFPTTSSVKQFKHYGQSIVSGKFRMYDYGIIMNQIVYDNIYPPEYPLEKVTTRVALFYSDNDWLSNPIDVMKLKDALPNVVETRLLEKYCHFDYVWGKHIRTEVYTSIMELIEKY